MSRRRGIEGGYLRDKETRSNWASKGVTEEPKPQEPIAPKPKTVKKTKKKGKKKTKKKAKKTTKKRTK